MTTTLNPFKPSEAAVLCSCGCQQPIPPGLAHRGVRYVRGHKTSAKATPAPVVLSGRCPECGYLRTSAGHTITCG